MPAVRAKFDQMWRIWYAILVLLLQTFLLYSAFQRYASFRGKALRESWDMSPMNFYLAMMLAACFLLPLFLFSAFSRTGNYAEDGLQVGRDNLRMAIAETGPASAPACCSRLRRHFLPYTCVLHLLMSMALLVPMPVLEAHEIQNNKLERDQIWRTNVDFLLRPTASATHSISTEVFNFALALSILLVRYPSVFWFSNRVFAFLFSIILCVCSLHALLSYEATSVLFKAAITGTASVHLAPAGIISLFTIGDLLLLLANIAFFEFGYAQMLNNLRKYRQYLQLEDASTSSDRSISSASSDEAPCWLSYAPHLLGILLMVLAVVCKAPVLWDWVGLYRMHNQPILLAATVSGAAYLVLWVAVWFLFGLKSNWRFNIRLDVEMPNKLGSGSFHHDVPDEQPPLPAENQSGTSGSDSDLGKKSGHYMFVPRDNISMIPTISEQVDNASENSYSCGGTMDRQSGLVKYQVRRNSAQSISQLSASGSLRRGVQNRKNANRVTFKDLHETIPGSPGSSQNASSDSGIEANRPAVQINPNDDYARVNKQRPPSRQSNNYEEYHMFGNMFQEPERTYYTRQELQMAHATYASQADVYGRLGAQPPSQGPPPPPPPPPPAAQAAAALNSSMFEEDGYISRVPDILLSRSPYGSLSRSAMAQQQQQQQQQQRMASSSDFAELPLKSYSSLPAQSQQEAGLLVGDHVDGLCSQV